MGSYFFSSASDVKGLIAFSCLLRVFSFVEDLSSGRVLWAVVISYFKGLVGPCWPIEVS